MQPPTFSKYSFRIRTRQGLLVDNLMIHGRDASDAERKLKQMYRDCEVIECTVQLASGNKITASSFEEIATLIARSSS
jgi:hypothetical protein